MTISAQDILIVAKEICKIYSEAGYRGSISRAYYAVYHGCLEWEKTFPAVGSSFGTNGGLHQQLVNRLKNPAPEIKDEKLSRLSRIIASRVEALKTKRTAADYKILSNGFTLVDAENSCAQAEDILKKIGVNADPQFGETIPDKPHAPFDSEKNEPPPDKEPDPSPPKVDQRPKLRRVH
jgi:hypothetical protein